MEQMGRTVGASLTLPSLLAMAQQRANQVDNRKVNIALCGLGRYANVLKAGLTASTYCHLAGIVTGTPAKAAQWMSEFNIPHQNCYTYQTFDQIIHNPAIDLVYITLPNGLHKEFTLRAAKAGKHVIVEKPMAFTPQDCQQMIDTCQKAGVQLY